MASWWDNFTDTAGKTIRTGWRGAVHIGGGVKNGGIKGAVFGLLLAAAAGIAITTGIALLAPAVSSGISFGLSALAGAGLGTAGMAASMATASAGVSMGGALTMGALMTIPALMITQAPHPFVRTLGLIFAVPAMAGVLAVGSAIGGAGAIVTGAIALTGATVTATKAPVLTKTFAIIGGALGGIGRIFNWPQKEVERETGIEQHKVLDARQEQQQVAAYEAEQAVRLEAAQQKAARFQMHNPIAQENGGSKILEKQKERQQEIGTGMSVAAAG